VNLRGKSKGRRRSDVGTRSECSTVSSLKAKGRVDYAGMKGNTTECVGIHVGG
jgi:hypothetical protein